MCGGGGGGGGGGVGGVSSVQLNKTMQSGVSVFITHTHSPSGWDNEKKIGILYEHMKSLSPDEPYEKIIMTPKTSQVRH